MRTSEYRVAFGVALLVALLMLCAVPAVSQEPDTATWVDFGNGYIKALVGTGGTVEVGGTDLDVNGRWAVVTKEGDPEITGDNDREIIYLGSVVPAHNYGYWKLRIGTTDYLIGDGGSGGWRNVGGIDDTPRAYPFPLIDPALGGQGKAGGYIRGTWRTNIAAGAPVDTTLKVSLVRDTVRFELTIQNNTMQALPIGLAMHGDVEVTSSTTVAYPFVPGVGFIKSTMYPDRFTGMLFRPTGGPKVPDYLEIYDNISKPALVARNTLALEDATKPDYVALGEYDDLAPLPPNSVWLPLNTYKPNPSLAINDLYWVLCWDQKRLAPGATRKIVTYYGVGAASSRWTYGTSKIQDHVVLAVQAPRSLRYDSTTAGETTASPDPFDVKAYVYNIDVDPGPYDLEDVSATIFLPTGLELVPGETRSKPVGAVPINTEALPVGWQVRATGEKTGELEYFVTAVDSTGWQQTVRRKIMVPADKQKVFEYGWQLVSVPFGFDNPDIAHVFGLNLGTFGAKYWDPINSPIVNSYFPVTQVQPGRGFWMAVGDVTGFGQTLPLPLASDAAITGESFGRQILEQRIDVYPGWNMIGNPFVYPVYWGQVLVYDKSLNQTFTLDDAADKKRWITRTLFAWNPQRFAYDNVVLNEHLLVPFQGYWLYVRSAAPKTLIFRPATFPEGEVKANIGGS